MKNKWLLPAKRDGVVIVTRKVAAINDSVQNELRLLAGGAPLPDDVVTNLVKRTLAQKKYGTHGGRAFLFVHCR